jgi:lipopolysaccharide transport system ATP-binding protein
MRVNGKVAALLELGAGFNPECTGRENIYINAAVLGMTGNEVDRCYNEIVRFADIGQFIDQPVKNYSSGMYVRLAFAIAVHVSPEILIIDEALAVGDIRFQQKCLAKIKKFCETGTVIFVTHDTTTVTELCSRVIWLESGHIQMDGPPKLVVEKYLQYMYEGGVCTSAGNGEVLSLPVERDSLSGFAPVDSDIRQFGDRTVTISGVRISSPAGDSRLVYGDQWCKISMLVNVHEDIPNTFAGYLIKDHFGREISGDRVQVAKLSVGRRYVITFQFEAWPNIADGEYTLTLGVGYGTAEDLTVSHFLHDILVFKSIPAKPAAAGILSVPNTGITLSEI